MEQWPHHPSLQPLNPSGDSIRLLRFDKERTDVTQYTIHHANLDEKVTYSAISYCWGAPIPSSRMRYVTIDGYSVALRPTLYHCLKVLSTHYPDAMLWVDAICINQLDLDERSQQVAIMGKIFGQASKVFVWLGSGDDEIAYALEHCDETPDTPFDQDQFTLSVQRLFRCRYWTRRWVIQEFALAKDLWLTTHACVVQWSHVMDTLTEKMFESDSLSLRNFQSFKDLTSAQSNPRLPLLSLLEAFRKTTCTNQNDKVFALLAIATDGKDFRPDYRESIGDVFFRLLSMQSTHEVLPQMVGYRFPHTSAHVIAKALDLNESSLLSSLEDKSSDRLFVALDCIGFIDTVIAHGDSKEEMAVVEPEFKYRYHIDYGSTFEDGDTEGSAAFYFSNDSLANGDLVYELRTSSRSVEGLAIAFSPDSNKLLPTGILVANPRVRAAYEHQRIQSFSAHQIFYFVEDLKTGIIRYRGNSRAEGIQARDLFHISRVAFVFLWCLDQDSIPPQIRKLAKTNPQTRSSFIDKTENPCASYMEPKLSNMIEYRSEHTITTLEILPNPKSTSPSRDWDLTTTTLWYEKGETLFDKEWLVRMKAHTPAELDISVNTWPRYLSTPSLRWSVKDINLWHHAAADGYHSFLRHFEADPPEGINIPDGNGYRPLDVACVRGHVKVVEALLATGRVQALSTAFDHGRPDDTGSAHRSALSLAVQYGHKTIVRLLLDYENPERTHEYYPFWTSYVLSSAVIRGQTEMIKIILDSKGDKIDVDALKKHDIWPLKPGETSRIRSNYAEHDKRVEIVRLLLSFKKKSLECNKSDRPSPLIMTILSGSMEMVDAKVKYLWPLIDSLLDNARLPPLTNRVMDYIEIIREASKSVPPKIVRDMSKKYDPDTPAMSRDFDEWYGSAGYKACPPAAHGILEQGMRLEGFRFVDESDEIYVRPRMDRRIGPDRTEDETDFHLDLDS